MSLHFGPLLWLLSDLFCCDVCSSYQTKAEEETADAAALAELQREVEDLKLRLHMAAEHYKEKYKECQRLQKQVLRLSEQQGVGPTGYQSTCWLHVPNKWKKIIWFLLHYVCLSHLTKWPLKEWVAKHIHLYQHSMCLYKTLTLTFEFSVSPAHACTNFFIFFSCFYL